MRIDVYSTMHNEAPILPYFLRHYGSFAQRIFVWEDESTDGTREILEAHPAVKLMSLEKHRIDDPYWLTLWAQYKTLSRGQADWAMVVDADEFIYYEDLPGLLECEKTLGAQVLGCTGYTMFSPTFPKTEGQIYEEVNRGLPDRLSYKDVVFDPEIDISWRLGRHGRSRARTQEDMPARRCNDSGVKLLHYRYLGQAYFDARYHRNIERREIFKQRYYKRNRLPDGTRGNPMEWYKAHEPLAVNIITARRQR